MTIFSRWALQEMINENAAFLSSKQLKQHVNGLNRGDLRSLDVEWEVAVLNAFSKLGKVSHEPDLGSVRPDLVFTSSDGSLALISDIVTASDAGVSESQPADDFYREFWKRVLTKGIQNSSFQVTIHDRFSATPKFRSELAIPKREVFLREVFTAEFDHYLEQIKNLPDGRHSFRVNTSSTSIHLLWDKNNPMRNTYTAAGFSQPLWKKRNPVYNGLKRKAQQLKRISSGCEIRAIILCDGDCDILAPVYRPYRLETPLEIVVKEFLRQNRSIAAVFVLSSEWSWQASHHFQRERNERFVSVRSFANPSVPAETKERLDDLATKLAEVVPRPSMDAMNARNSIENGYDQKKFKPMSGGFTMTRDTLSISANTVLALLAGEITFEEYTESIRGIEKQFGRAIREGKRIARVSIVNDRTDDASIAFGFERDPAVSDFVSPDSQGEGDPS